MAISRKTLFKVHNGLGLGVLVVVLVSALTGTLLTFRAQLSTPPPVAPVVELHLSLDALVAKAEAAGDGSPATDLSIPLAADQPYRVWLDDDDETQVFLDGAGEVLETRSGRSGLTRWVFRLHTGELFGVAGQALMVAMAMGLCVLGMSGFGMWWSRRRRRRG